MVPGGIKLCSPGTFGVVNYLIINNGSSQVNFTKPNMATILYTNSQWLRENATEVPVGRVAVPKTVQKPSSPREDDPEVPVGRVAVPKTGQKRPLPREDDPKVPVGRVAVPKTGQKNTSPRDNLYLMCPACFQCARDPQASLSLQLSAAIDLREIHLARQS